MASSNASAVASAGRLARTNRSNRAAMATMAFGSVRGIVPDLRGTEPLGRKAAALTIALRLCANASISGVGTKGIF